MKKSITILVFLIGFTVRSSGQWYYEKYFVHDINMLSLEQLNEAKNDTKGSMAVAGCIAVAGGLLIWGGDYTLRKGLGEDPSFIEELLGAEFMGKFYIALGAGCTAGGTIATLLYFGRFERINSLIKRNFGSIESVRISPSLICCGLDNAPVPGVSVKLRF